MHYKFVGVELPYEQPAATVTDEDGVTNGQSGEQLNGTRQIPECEVVNADRRH